MSDTESGTAAGHTGTCSGSDSTSNSLIRLQLTLWQQHL
ncbi:hypothetical protein J2X01_000887 [Arthrobacter ginsengisoli]|uniref:Uncharacterized protein n=1 Tax=Arthrobacter ginsengisoli TaxID=1356565 RepID=A0ABU1U8T7_9MICC|nr:hypothetical protein [Arthrobacter ginsengisoli]